MEQAFNALEGRLVLWVMGKIVAGTAWAAQFLLTAPAEYLSSPAFLGIYRNLTLMADMLLLPLTAGYGIAVLLGHQGKVTEAAQRLGIAAILTNAAPWLVALLAESANVMARWVAGAAAFSLPTKIEDTPGAELMLVIFLVAYLWFMVRLILQAADRYFSLLLWTAAAPILFVISVLPGQEHRISKWAKEISGLLVEQLALALQLVLMVSLTIGPGSITQSKFTLFLLQIGALISMTKTPAVIREWVHLESPSLLRTGFDLLTLQKLRTMAGQKQNKRLAKGFLKRVVRP